MHRLGLLAATAVIVAACSSPPTVQVEESADAEPVPTATPSAPPPVDPAPDADADVPPEGGDRLVVQDALGGLFTILPDGSDPLPLVDAAEATASQPTWSPDGGRLVWNETDRDGSSHLVTARFDQSGRLAYDLDAPATYLAWDPSSTRVASLHPVGAEITLAVTDVAREIPTTPLDRGSPYWFSWGPDGDELFVHASGFRADRVGLDGTTLIIDDDAGAFQTPVWTGADRALVYARARERAELLSAGPDGEGRLPIATYDGYLQFVVHPDQTRIALHVVEPPPDLGDIITTAAPPAIEVIPAVAQDSGGDPVEPDTIDPVDPVDELPRDLLLIMAVYGGDPIPVDEDPALAFFWDPTGAHLAYLVQVSEDPSWFEWRFYDGSQVFPGPTFRPSEVSAADYLPRFDQYAQSHRFFSPDGSAFVYAGESPDGRSGIWVVPVAPGVRPELVAEGEFAAWSPGPAGSQGTIAP